MTWRSDKAWSDRYIQTIKSVVGPHLLVASSLDVDRQQATDLIVLRARDMMIAARVRRAGYADRYPNDFTIRSQRDSGAVTEFDKIVNGFGDWMFYGHAADDTSVFLSRWMLIDLHAWRAHLIRSVTRRRITPRVKDNGDGTRFLAFNCTEFVGEPRLIIACSHPEQMTAQPELFPMAEA